MPLKSLLGAVDWVLDPKNNRIIYKQSETDGKNCSAWHGDKTFTGDLKQVGHAWCQAIRDYDNPAHSFDKISHVQYWVGCKGGAGSVVIYCELGEGSVSFNDITQQIIKNAKAGHAESVEFILTMEAEKANEDTDTSNPDKEKDEAEEKPKTDKPIKQVILI